eukprot:13113438-Alexandrium_andersonii.AAC.1
MIDATSLRRHQEAISQPGVRFVHEHSAPTRPRKAAEFALRWHGCSALLSDSDPEAASRAACGVGVVHRQQQN